MYKLEILNDKRTMRIAMTYFYSVKWLNFFLRSFFISTRPLFMLN